MKRKRTANDLEGEGFRRHFQGHPFQQRDRIVQGIKDLFALSAIGDQIIHAQQAEMVADGRLRKVQLFAKRTDIAFAVGQREKDI